MTGGITRERYERALRFEEYVATAAKNAELWRSLYRTVSLPPELVERAGTVQARWHLLVLSEDWCGDAVNAVPVIARLADAAPNLDLRILRREENPDLTDAHRTAGTRSIPVVMALDAQFREHGWWGPRPAVLQRWVRSEWMLLPKDERYKRTRSWYARDRGRSIIMEVVEMLERAERRRQALDHRTATPDRADAGGEPTPASRLPR
jgi:hypothetical protein